MELGDPLGGQPSEDFAHQCFCEVVLFAGAQGADGDGSQALDYLKASDIELTRVVEDLVDVLVAKRIIAFTDLPEAVRQKLERRARTRSQLPVDDGGLFIGEDDIL